MERARREQHDLMKATKMKTTYLLLLFALGSANGSFAIAQNWPQAAGPDGDTMIGNCYAFDCETKHFDESALIALNPLGPRGETWSMNTPTFAGGKLYHRTAKELICVGYQRARANANDPPTTKANTDVTEN